MKAKRTMAAKRPAVTKRWTFKNTAELVAWMEDEYLSEVVLEDLRPAPGTPAKTAAFTWWLHGAGGPSKVPYHVEARGVSEWTLAGTLDGSAIGFDVGHGEGVRLVMSVPGRLTLHCEELAIERGKKKKLPRPRKPFTDYAYFHVEGRGRPSPTALLHALGAPKDARVVTEKGPSRILVGEDVWVELYDFPAKAGEYHWNVVRRDATDAQWHRAQELPHHLGAREVSSAWEFVGSPAAWLVTIGATPTKD